LSELNADDRRFEIEPALGAANSETRQIRVFDSEGNDKATVVDFQDKNGKVSIYLEDITKKIRQQFEVLLETADNTGTGDNKTAKM
jgi:hypothetical protein